VELVELVVAACPQADKLSPLKARRVSMKTAGKTFFIEDG